MNPFLKQISTFLIEHYGNEMGEVCVVFPNTRPALYFRKYLSEGLSVPAWAPDISTITAFMQQHSTLNPVDELSLIFTLYKEYLKLTDSAESFDSFYSWGKILTSDFDDIDTYMADAQKVFSNIKDIREIDKQFASDELVDIEVIRSFWGNILTSKNSSEREVFLKTWELLPDLYRNHRASLITRKCGSQGMMYRDAAEHTERFDVKKTYFFAGFNVLTECEKTIFLHLQKEKSAVFFWDYDRFYIDNEKHEAGRFLRANLRLFPMPLDFAHENNLIAQNPPQIECVAAPSSVAQVKYTGMLLEEMFREKKFIAEETAVILGNEEILPFLLQSIPENAGAFNVSMGTAVKDTQAVAWLRNVILLQQKVRITDEYKFYHKYVVSLLSHPYTRILSDETESLIQSITRNNLAYVSPKFFESKPFLSKLFSFSAGDVSTFSEYLLEMMQILLENEQHDDYNSMVRKEIIYRLYQSISDLNRIIKQEKIAFSGLNAYIHLIDQIIKTTVVPFEGEPLQGMQVLGLLETRLLDFKNIVVLSLNEGSLPKTGKAPSFIPDNLRFAYHLPTQQHVDSLYAYYFYRLLQRSEKLVLLHQMATKDVGGGEPSRYVQQLKYEYNQKIKFNQLNYQVKVNAVKAIEVSKSAETMDFLLNFVLGKNTERKLSASVLNLYLKCPLSFYFSVVAGIKEPDGVDEDTDARQFGNIFHNSIKAIYEPFVITGKTVNEQDLKNLLQKDNNMVRNAVLHAFNHEYKTNYSSVSDFYGKHRLFFEIIFDYIEKTIENDRKNVPFIVYGVEKNVNICLDINLNNSKLQAFVKAKIDRIDLKDGKLIVLDYKTGKTSRNFSSIEALFERGRSKDLDYVFQILLYSSIVSKSKEHDYKVVPALLSIQELFDLKGTSIGLKSEKNKPPIPVEEFDIALESAYNNELIKLLEEILDDKLSFCQYPDEKKCSFCNFVNICYTV